MTNARDPRERLMSKVAFVDGCWEWQGALDKGGYGAFFYGKGMAKAHRVSYALFVGPIPEGLFIDHTCHNRACVNPEHLRPVTNKQNLEHRRGANPNSKSGVRGVFWSKRLRKWYGNVQHNGRNVYVGVFEALEDADRAVRAKRAEIFTHSDNDKEVAA